MTTEAPKRIWATPSFARGVNGPHRNVLGEAAIQYIRADIADEMLEALKEAKSEMRDWGPDHPVMKEIDAAIAKAKGTTE